MKLIHTAFVPAGDGPHPTMVALHGFGASALDLLGIAPHLAAGKVLMICPQGQATVPIGPGMNGYGWYEFGAASAAEQGKISAAADLVMEFIDQAIEAYPVDRGKLVLMGFSQGGMMAFHLALRNPRKFAALVAGSTAFPAEAASQVSDPEGLRELPTLIQHGSSDPMISIDRAHQSVEALRALQIPLIYREYECGHEITAQGLADLSNFITDKVIKPIIFL